MKAFLAFLKIDLKLARRNRAVLFFNYLFPLMFFFIFGWVKATVPRYRYDQLMRLGWKVFLPLSLGMVVVVAAVRRELRQAAEPERAPAISPPGRNCVTK